MTDTLSTSQPRRRSTPVPDALRAWFAARGWRPASFQREVWRRYQNGESGLLHTPTGSGKTLAAIGGALLEGLAEAADKSSDVGTRARRGPQATTASTGPLVLWITPLKALASDTERALREAVQAVGLDWRVSMRTGDASARDKRLARQGRLEVLVLTPESLALLLSYADTQPGFSRLRLVVVDEWHELLGNKRGVLLQLGLARLRALNTDLRIWGLSATLGNLAQARDVLLPHQPGAALVGSATRKMVRIQTLLPARPERFSWSGQAGLSQLEAVLQSIMAAPVNLLFVNTRAQAELWHRALQAVWPESLQTLALHHGSIDPALRRAAELGLREGRLRCVVATSSLDLGVDFPAVDQVLQLGSPKAVARLQQRAGRARHRPGTASRIIGVPTQTLELLEYAAVRQAIENGELERRQPLELSLDVLCQHCVSMALSGGFEPDSLLREVRGTHAFRNLCDDDWRAILDFIVRGGQALAQYPDYHRVVVGDDGLWRVTSRRVALRHRLSIGTIVSDGMVMVQYLRGGRLGAIEEGFVSRLRLGDRFHFAGRLIELVRLEDMTAYVRKANGRSSQVAQWNGSRLPLSGLLAHRVEQLLVTSAAPDATAPAECRAAAPMLELQAQLSALPEPGQLLAESFEARRRWHLCLYPFQGAHVHEALAALLSWRWSQRSPNSFSFAASDYGLLISAERSVSLEVEDLRQLLSPQALLHDLQAALNMTELARRQFREIARVAGLLVPALPGGLPRSMRQLQASSGLLFDVFERYDPQHLLLRQARVEVLQQQLDWPRLEAWLQLQQQRDIQLQRPKGFTPLSFALWAQSARGSLSNEDWRSRMERAVEHLERRHGRRRT